MNAWLPKNLNLTQAKIFLRSKNISFGLGLNFWLVRQDTEIVGKSYKSKPALLLRSVQGRDISFGLGLNFWHVHQDMKYSFKPTQASRLSFSD